MNKQRGSLEEKLLIKTKGDYIMPLNGYTPCSFYHPLSNKDIQKIHEASVRVLEEVGFMVEHDGALNLLEEAGCKVDYNNKVAKIPEKVLMDYIKMAPARIRMCGRDLINDVIVEPNKVFFDGGGGSIKIYDIETGERRDSTLKDLAQMSKITDALEHVHLMDTPCMPNDVPLGEVDLNRFFATTYNCSKPLMIGAYDDPDKMIRMAQMIAGGEEALRKRPFLSIIICTISPLKLEPTYIDKIFKFVEAGIPVFLDPCPTAGLNAPLTLAGLLVQINAEALFNVFFPQVIKAGAPAFYTVVPNTADMRTSRFLFGSIENAIMNAGLSQMATFYNLPMYSTAGLTEAKVGDFQAGIEKAMQVLLVALSGAQIVHDTNGMLDSSLTYSAEQLVVDNEVNGMVLRALRGIDVTKDTLAEEVIKKVSHTGSFLTEEHTFRHARTEMFFPKLANRNEYDEWLKGGKRDMIDKAHEVVLDLLKNHEPKRLSDDLVKDLKKEFPEIRVEDCLV